MRRALLIVGAFALLVVLIWLAYVLQVPGFVAAGDPKTQQYQPGKTIWDWMQLLIIPAALGLGTLWFTAQQSQRQQHLSDLQHAADQQRADEQRKAEQELAEQRRKIELELAQDQQRENVLQAYLDHMAELLLKEHLRTSPEEAEVRQIARVRTLTVLRALDARRNAVVLRFLDEAGLRQKEHPIVNLSYSSLRDVALQGAELSRLNLNGLNLSEANLSEAFLIEANLSGAFLTGAKLRGANLSGANLSGRADLSGADLSYANLSGTLLTNTNLSGANFFQANLLGAYLSEAPLAGAYLSGADPPRDRCH